MNLETARKLDEEVEGILKLIPHGYEFKVDTKERETYSVTWLPLIIWSIEMLVLTVLYNIEATSSDIQGNIAAVSTMALPIVAFGLDITRLRFPLFKKKLALRITYNTLYDKYGQTSASALIRREHVDPVKLFAKLDKAVSLQFAEENKLDNALPLARRIREKARERAAVRAEMDKLG